MTGRCLLSAVATLLAVASVSAAAPPRDAGWRLSYWQSQPAVEQQAGVTNRTGCVWDVDDVTKWEAAGMLQPGQSVSTSGCLVADWGKHLVRLHPLKDGLAAALTVAGISVAAAGSVCIDGPWYDHQAVLPPVPDSDGGVGVVTTVTFTVTNMTGKRIRDARAAAEISYQYGDTGAQGPYPCPPFGERQGVYPGPWWRIAR